MKAIDIVNKLHDKIQEISKQICSIAISDLIASDSDKITEQEMVNCIVNMAKQEGLAAQRDYLFNVIDGLIVAGEIKGSKI